ncbi:A disintegrin and metalloproteinase with thrombospondin motifs adt-1-like [Xenia sp. Carnegie-2017]|uniref:A disintegrin and metalloproteinase with thrombospondin motifs adt-1-like n=1 Tax=Xenia sp. Carnegie-2017 TaxID=2897299 RepID=UPI001F03AED1|nr:A disintegrin and metalloproteinase with thrombospondin motifs adt-1-like [Xenia sp. Carnegie-2017]
MEIILHGKITFDITVNVTTQDHSAKSNEDYILNTSSVKFTPNDSGPKIVNISLIRDNLHEMAEDFFVLLNVSDENVNITMDKTNITILDSDDVAVLFEKNHYVFHEGKLVSVPISLDRNISIPVNVSIVSDSFNATAKENSDYNIVNPIVVFKPNDGKKTIGCNLTIFDDGLVERNETFFLETSPKTKGKQSTKVTIISKNVATVNFSKSFYSVLENNNNVSIEVILHGNITFDITVNLVTKNGSAEEGVHYRNPTTNSITFKPSQQEIKEIKIPVINNNISESEKNFIVKVESSDLNVVSNESATIWILKYDLFTEWSGWSNCICGVRNRTCRYHWAVGDCFGKLMETEPCDISFCSDDNKEWPNKEGCNVTCMTPVETKNCLNTTQYSSNLPVKCPFRHCPVDGCYKEWGKWSQCSKTCGSGKTHRTRQCSEPLYGGKNCHGDIFYEEKICTNPVICPDEFNFTSWSEWSICNVSCNFGQRIRTRVCKEESSKFCKGRTNQTETCNAGPCPQNGNWSTWSEWPYCPGSCGSAILNRSRTCNNPPPKHGGNNCSGAATEEMACNHTKPCTNESGFTEWSTWSLCSKTCDNGEQVRERNCRPGQDMYCTLESLQRKQCFEKACPVNGGWSQWGEWSRCSSSCGSGVKYRVRLCNSPKPDNDGLKCYGKQRRRITILDEKHLLQPHNDKPNYTFLKIEKMYFLPKYPPENPNPICISPEKDYQYLSCYDKSCKIDGNFSHWSFWSLCSVTCGGGIRRRKRMCDHPSPKYGGKDCPGKRLDVQDCNASKTCPDDDSYKPWTSWSNCSRGCEGTTTRKRDCKENCSISQNQTKECNTELCVVNGSWSEWTSWSLCDLNKCGEQSERRNRVCDDPKPQAGGEQCMGDDFETMPCRYGQPRPCNKKITRAGWTDWSWWKICSKSCGKGVESRYRRCINPPPTSGGLKCSGKSNETKFCNDCPCPGNYVIF